MREFLTEKELLNFKNWIAINGFDYEDITTDNVVFAVFSGRFHFEICTTSDPELFEVCDLSEKQSFKELLEAFNKTQVCLYGIEIPSKKAEKFLPEECKDIAHMFDHFRMVQRPDKLWDLIGAVGFYGQKLKIVNHKLPLKVLGSNFLEQYWTIIYMTRKEQRRELW